MRLGWRIYATKIRPVGVRVRDAALTVPFIVSDKSLVEHRTTKHWVQWLRVTPDSCSATLTAHRSEK